MASKKHHTKKTVVQKETRPDDFLDGYPEGTPVVIAPQEALTRYFNNNHGNVEYSRGDSDWYPLTHRTGLTIEWFKSSETSFREIRTRYRWNAAMDTLTIQGKNRLELDVTLEGTLHDVTVSTREAAGGVYIETVDVYTPALLEFVRTLPIEVLKAAGLTKVGLADERLRDSWNDDG